MAVPAPYFDAGKGTVYFGTIKATEVSEKWLLESASYRDPIEIKPPTTDLATEFWTRIKELPGCLPKFDKDPKDNPENEEYLKWIVLCAIRDHTNADVALIQHQDLFDQIPDFLQSNEGLLERAKTGQSPSELNERMQQTLDSLIWKGDLVTLLYVPGGDLKKALKQSDKYAAEENATLALSVDKGRQLERLGIREKDGEYFINDVPLDEKKIYAVATTDYIGAGDTGYPDLVKAALNPRTHPAAFSLDLIPVSSLVCHKLFRKSDEAMKYCLGPVESDKYLDETIAKRIPPYKQPDFFKKVGEFFKSGWPGGSTEPKTINDAIETTVHRREIWRYSLENFSVGFKALGKNLSDKEVGEKFEGIPVSGVTATESETWNVGINTRLTRSSHKREFFVSTGLEFERQENGDIPSAFQISEAKNRLFGETGLVVWRTPGRSLPNFGMNFSVYAETQVTRPFSDFTLASSDKFRISQDRSVLLLPRFGLRWQGKANAAEVGVQAGRELNALSGYRFATAAGDVECLAIDTPSFSKCIKEKSDPEKGGTITIDSERTVLANDRPRVGMYWKLNLSRPFTSKVKYELVETGDFFFVNAHQDTTVDTRLRVISKHRLSFEIWPSVSIGPALDLLLYQNKRNRDFLFQRQFGIETKISFDIFNRREKTVQLKHKP